MSLQLSDIGGAQDFGDEFQFEEDSGALNSILNNQGVSRAQVHPPKTPNKVSFTPAKAVPESFRNREERFDFFENKGGQVFFRRKIVPGSEKKILPSSARKPGGHERKLGNVTTHMVPQRMPMSARKRSPFGKSPGHRAALIMDRQPLAQKNSNFNQIPNTRVLPPKFPVALTERKPEISKQPVRRQGLSEQKEKVSVSGIPRPAMADNHARQSLYRKFEGDKAGGGSKTQAPTFEPSLTKLTRESFRLLPRESMAWLTQLPRESATFAELEKMMTENDRDCVNDDDTMSFEALESRMRTPYKESQRTPRVIEDKENTPSNLSGIEPIMMNDTLASPLANSGENDQNAASKAEVDVGEVGASKAEVDIVGEDKPGDDVEVNVSLRRVASNIDLTTEQDPEVPLARASSLGDVAGVESLSPLVATSDLVTVLDSLDTYQEQLDRFRAEQDRLINMEQEILTRIRQRKTEFKSLWGVSPINIKTKRTIIKPLSPMKFNLDINDEVVKNDTEEVQADDTNETPVKIPATEQNPPETEKRVRFNPSHNETRAMTPSQELEDTLDQTPVSSHGKRNTRNKSRKSFDSLKCSLAFLKTPQTAMRSQGPRHTPSAAPTPMALRHLSDRVMAEFAALYSDSSDDTDTANSMLQNPIARLAFDK